MPPSPLGLDLRTLATVAGQFRWIERQLFEITGEWSTARSLRPAVRLGFVALSAHHAWRSTLWEVRIPPRIVADPDALPAPTGWVDEMDALRREDGIVGRPVLFAYRSMLDALHESAVMLRALIDVRSDGPSAAVVRKVIVDLANDLTVFDQFVAVDATEGAP